MGEKLNSLIVIPAKAGIQKINFYRQFWDFRKPFLYYNVIVLGKPLYIENYDKYIVLRNEAMFQMEDFSIFGEKWMFETAKNKLRDIINA